MLAGDFPSTEKNNNSHTLYVDLDCHIDYGFLIKYSSLLIRDEEYSKFTNFAFNNRDEPAADTGALLDYINRVAPNDFRDFKSKLTQFSHRE